ncbi:MAG: prepilin-type N-terminal cleavage/methylation domain-containing protein [Magnetococcales bacterium]|nr:prepilin-type N-terminal cleavage/methylation domain-containing protein [Magnetococcales bacterium]
MLRKLLHPRVKHHGSLGLTLIEMVVTLVVFSVVAGVGAVSLSNGFKAYQTAREIQPLALNAQIVLKRLQLEIRNAATCPGVVLAGAPVAGGGNSALQFTNDQGRVLLVNQGSTPTNAIFVMFNNDNVEWLLSPNVEAGSLKFQMIPCDDFVSPGLVTFSFTMTSTVADGTVIRLPFRTSVYIRSTS